MFVRPRQRDCRRPQYQLRLVASSRLAVEFGGAHSQRPIHHKPRNKLDLRLGLDKLVWPAGESEERARQRRTQTHKVTPNVCEPDWPRPGAVLLSQTRPPVIAPNSAFGSGEVGVAGGGQGRTRFRRHLCLAPSCKSQFSCLSLSKQPRHVSLAECRLASRHLAVTCDLNTQTRAQRGAISGRNAAAKQLESALYSMLRNNGGAQQR